MLAVIYMTGKSKAKYERLFAKLNARFDDRDLTELLELTESARSLERFDVAIAFLRLAIYFKPDLPILWGKLAQIYHEQQNDRKATEAYKEAWRLIRSQPVNYSHISFCDLTGTVIQSDMVN